MLIIDFHLFESLESMMRPLDRGRTSIQEDDLSIGYHLARALLHKSKAN